MMEFELEVRYVPVVCVKERTAAFDMLYAPMPANAIY
jgi:hypothetical protein